MDSIIIFCKKKTLGKCVVLIRIHSAVHFYFDDNCPLKLLHGTFV